MRRRTLEKALVKSTKAEPHQYDLEEAIARSVEGQSATLYAQDALWSEKYRALADQFFYALPEKATFIGEDLRKLIAPQIGEPKHPNAWGAIFGATIRAWRKLGYVQSIGMAPMTAKTSHARQSMLYEKR